MKFLIPKTDHEGRDNFLADLHCCDKAGKKQCRDSCRRILRIKTTGQEIVDSLQEGGCGPPLLHVSVCLSSNLTFSKYSRDRGLLVHRLLCD
jgi:hypothetical protein